MGRAREWWEQRNTEREEERKRGEAHVGTEEVAGRKREDEE